MNRDQYIPWSSAHPVSVKKVFVKAELTRYMIISSKKDLFEEKVRNFALLIKTTHHHVPDEPQGERFLSATLRLLGLLLLINALFSRTISLRITVTLRLHLGAQ